ncbi:OPT oligopeptide transporter protein-domain-containing protein [Lipomyces doorenjongii]
MAEYDEKNTGAVEVRTSSSVGETESTSLEKTDGTYIHYTDEEKDRVYEFMCTVGGLADNHPDDIEFLMEKMKSINAEDGFRILTDAMEYHQEDVNFPEDAMAEIRMLLKGTEHSNMDQASYDLRIRFQATLIHFHSPYPEVRAVVRPTDDRSMPCETFRAYLVGGFWVCCASFINQMFHQRQPSITLNATVLQILIFPSGKFIARVFPHKKFTFWRWSLHLNPGPWSFKEQMFATIMTNIGAGSSNFFHYGLALRLPIFFGFEYANFGFMLLMCIVTLFFGYGLAGMLRRYAVYPVKALWPQVLPILQLNKTLLLPETKQSINGWTISKYRLFCYSFFAMFFFFWLPNYLFTALSTFNWISWIAPKNVPLAYVTGSKSGLGFNPWTTFDWSVVNYTTPLVLPFFSVANKFVGVLIGGLVIIGMYWSNYKYTGYFPPNNANVYDNMGKKYNVSRIYHGGHFDVDAYRNYSQTYIGAGQIMMLGAYYTMYTCAFAYIFLNEWQVISRAMLGFFKSLRFWKRDKKSTYEQFHDPMSAMMVHYKEVPDWWYLAVMIGSLAIGIIAITCYPTGTPVWALIIIILMSIALVIPTIIISSMTGYLIPGDTLAVIVAGFMVPGNAAASIILRVFGYNTDDQAENFISDLKLAHYAKLPPRGVFRAQIVATLMQSFITTGAITWLINSTPDLCTANQAARLVCAFPNQLYSTTILLGVVGPRRTYDVQYPLLKYAFLFGALFGVGFWYVRKRYTKYLRHVHPVIILSGINRYGATYNLSYFTPGFYVGFIFNYYIRRRYLAWWSKYNYILTSGLTGGMAFSGILIFFSVQYKAKKLIWWGNTVSASGVDGIGTASLYQAPSNGFGPPVGSWD